MADRGGQRRPDIDGVESFARPAPRRPAADVVTLGETMVLLDAASSGLLRHAQTLRVSVGGSESNVAIGLRRLGLHPTWIGRVGADEFGELVLSTLRGQDLDVRARQDSSAPTGVMVKEHRTSQLGRVWYYRTGSAGSRIGPEDLDEDDIRGARVLHLTGITPALSARAAATVDRAVDLAQANGVAVSLDLNYRGALWRPEHFGRAMRRLLPRVKTVFGSPHEVAHVVGGEPDPDSQLKALAALGPQEVVLKLGAQGGSALVDGRVEHVSAYPVTVVDTVGAGDAFVAGWLAATMSGADPIDCLRRATLCGALACTATGDWEGAATAAEVGDLLAGRADEVVR